MKISKITYLFLASKLVIKISVSFIFIFLLIAEIHTSTSQKKIITGKITDATTNRPLANTNIKIANQNLGTASDSTGKFQLFLPPGTYTIIFSYIGYHCQQKTITILPESQSVILNISLKQKVLPGQEISIMAPTEEPRITRLDLPPAKLVTIANPLPDALISLKTLPGVSSRNDQSTFYNVRGGNYDENLIYLNDVEIYQPILVRKGIAENPSLVNPYLIQSINLRTGAFPVQYGDKLSSVLDITYREGNSETTSGMVGLSSISANLLLEGSVGKKATWILGMRKVNYGYLLDALQTKGTYTPDFKDIQLGFTWHINSQSRLKFFGHFGDSQFKHTPESWSSTSSRTEVTGMVLHGYESFNYKTGALGLQYNSQIIEGIHAQIGFSSFNQWERENSHIEYSITSKKIDSLYPQPETFNTSQPDSIEHFRTKLNISLHRLFFNGSLRMNQNHQFNFGLEFNNYKFKDQLYQTVSRISNLDFVQPHSIASRNVIRSIGISVYGEYYWQPISFASIRVGLRFTEFDFNKEMLLMPRLHLLFHLAEKTDLFVATGRYTQPPLYKEFRSIGQERSPDLKAQKSDQFTLGLERRWQKNMSFRIEAYYKRLWDLISYDLWDVRLVYSGKNDAIGYVYGIDAHLRGDFIPDCLAWLSYSYMVAREDLDYDDEGWVPRPSDQRHVFAATLQDKMVRFPGSRIHIRILYASGNHYTYQTVTTNEAGEESVVFSKRNAFTTPVYRRFDIGFTQQFKLNNFNIILREEILNLFDIYNVLGYSWINGVKMEQGLSRRTYSIGIQAEF
jgi:outer membrane receptor protein involved in Fe transport